MVDQADWPDTRAPDPDVRVTRTGLTFMDATTEAAFSGEWDADSAAYLRIGFRIGFLLFAGFGLFDLVMVPEAIAQVLLVRIVTCAWILVAERLAARTRPGSSLQRVLTATSLVVGLAMIAITMIADGIASYTYYAGLLMVIVAVSMIIRLRFTRALASVVVLNVAYAASLVIDPALPVLLVINNVTFVIGVSGLSLMAAFLLERSSREGFGQRRIADARAAHLADALANVRELSGLIPVCAWCHKVRTDDGYWQKIESYVTEHSKAQFSHGMCPDCFGRMGDEAPKGEGSPG